VFIKGFKRAGIQNHDMMYEKDDRWRPMYYYSDEINHRSKAGEIWITGTTDDNL